MPSGTYLLGLETGRTEGLERGRRMTLVDMILTLLEVRGITVDGDTEARVRSCDSLATLQHWARRAREVAQARELLASQ